MSKAYRGYLLPAIEAFLAQRRSQAEDIADIEQAFQAMLQSHFAREQFRANGWRQSDDCRRRDRAVLLSS